MPAVPTLQLINIYILAASVIDVASNDDTPILAKYYYR